MQRQVLGRGEGSIRVGSRSNDVTDGLARLQRRRHDLKLFTVADGKTRRHDDAPGAKKARPASRTRSTPAGVQGAMPSRRRKRGKWRP